MPANASIIPADYQPPLPLDRFVVAETPDEDGVPLDVLIIGAGPAGLSAAIELARLARADDKLAKIEIGILEKAQTIGGHCLSGAVVNPSGFAELFPDLPIDELPLRGAVPRDRVYLLTERGKFRIPTPPTMNNHGNYMGSICEIVRWLGERAEDLGLHVMTGYPADSLLVEGAAVIGARTTPSGVRRSGEQGADFAPATDVSARITVLAEGTRGSLTQAYLQWRNIASPNPQVYALGVKELWETPHELDAVVHTLGWPLPRDAFGGSFMYPMGDNLIALGLVVGLDYHRSTLDVHELLQRMKLHPFFEQYLKDGKMIEWGAKTIPEGGLYSLPERLSGDGLLIIGDAAGFVEVSSLKGIHYAMHSGVMAARAIFEALKTGEPTSKALSQYDDAVRESCIHRDLHQRRNMRLGFKSGFFTGGLKAALLTLTRGRFPGGMISIDADAAAPRRDGAMPPLTPDGKRTFSKVDAVGRSDNATRDDIPLHVVAAEEIDAKLAEFYTHMCPAGVYEWDGEKLVINAPNCVDCKATDILGPRWLPREGGSGPSYKQM